jgi:hypothetical protein
MLRQIALFTLISSCFLTAELSATWNDITISQSRIIQDGDQYVRVFVHDSSSGTTAVDVTGGQIGTLWSYDHSEVTISGGNFSAGYYSFHPENNDGDNLYLCPSVHRVYVSDHSHIYFASGSVDSVQCEDRGTLDITGGEISIDYTDHATINITGGIVDFSGSKFEFPDRENNSHLYVSGGQFLGYALLTDNSIMEIYGYGFSYDPNDYDPDPRRIHYGGKLTGFWQDRTLFTMEFRDFLQTHSYDHVILHEVEPFNHLPVADAGHNKTIYACADGMVEVQLDGSGSYDDDGDELTYQWTWIVDSNEMTATGVDPNILLSVGEHSIELIVNDGTESSEPNDVIITVIGPVEADVHIVPRVINRTSRMKRVFAIVRLGEGINKADVSDESFVLYAGDLDSGGIEASWQRVIGRGNQATVFALFDNDELMAAVPTNGRVELTLTGKLTSGQCIYGSDTVRIIKPPPRRGRRRGR